MAFDIQFVLPADGKAVVAAFIFVSACWLSVLRRSTVNKCVQDHDVCIHQTQILSCRISHFRLFPKRHGFVYPYLSIGIPVRSPISSWLLSIDQTSWWKRGWLHITAEDYLNRGSNGITLEESIDEYLKEQNLDPAEYPHIYLLTSARFLNYKFSPASFWYLYNKDLKLEYVIAEVNNTFGERRMYLFPAPDDPTTFRQTCTKDFHVSPFSSRKGSYVLSTTDPLRDKKISVRITLRSSKGHTKLVARWCSTAPAINPSKYSIVSSLWYLACWGFSVLVTFPRIVLNAIILAQFHKLSIWHRPEPRESALPRRATADETFLASIFARYVKYLYDQDRIHGLSPQAYGISLQPFACADKIAIGPDTPETPVLELRIHTPAFYRHVITFPTPQEYIRYTMLNPHPENRTAYCNNEPCLIQWLESAENTNNPPSSATGQTSERMRTAAMSMAWSLFCHLRTTKRVRGSYPSPGHPVERTHPCATRARPRRNPTCGRDDTWGNSYALDKFVRGNCETWVQVRYMCAVLGVQWRAGVMGAIGGE